MGGLLVVCSELWLYLTCSVRFSWAVRDWEAIWTLSIPPKPAIADGIYPVVGVGEASYYGDTASTFPSEELREELIEEVDDEAREEAVSSAGHR